MDKFDLKNAYISWTNRVKSRDLPPAKALQTAIGGEFEAFGIIQSEMLKFFGLNEDSYVIDVGCGSGRLAAPLSQWSSLKYLGFDVVPDLVDHARQVANREDWKFAVVDKIEIPEKDGKADMVCFFSVLTHLLHEQSYIYLEEARRVLKPGGVIVLSFLEFAMAFHWDVFAGTVADAKGGSHHPLNVFISRDALEAWAKRLDLELVQIRDGDEPFVPLPQPVTLEDGRVMESFGNLGQSICVLRKPEA
ncbi:MAG: class I SAM-dependent methyltransferase [Burkholderiales bacterium]|nr:class I SAM-dependent methyltransferase [Burkholderiales bacterium]